VSYLYPERSVRCKVYSVTRTRFRSKPHELIDHLRTRQIVPKRPPDMEVVVFAARLFASMFHILCKKSVFCHKNGTGTREKTNIRRRKFSPVPTPYLPNIIYSAIPSQSSSVPIHNSRFQLSCSQHSLAVSFPHPQLSP